MSLGLADRDGRLLRSAEKNIFAQNWENLTSLSVKPLTTLGFKDLTKGMEKSKLISLQTLHFLMMPNEMCDLEKIKPRKLPNLKHLSVQRCITSEKSLKYLSELVTHWILHTLDISHNLGINEETLHFAE